MIDLCGLVHSSYIENDFAFGFRSLSLFFSYYLLFLKFFSRVFFDSNRYLPTYIYRIYGIFSGVIFIKDFISLRPDSYELRTLRE